MISATFRPSTLAGMQSMLTVLLRTTLAYHEKKEGAGRTHERSLASSATEI
jgi:hypothetical protein